MIRARRLGQSHHPGAHAQALGEVRRLALEALRQRRALGARPHQTHLALEDIDDLRQLVEMEPAQQPSHRRHPRLPPGRPDRPRAVLGAHDHGAELDDAKDAPVAAQTRLAVQDGAAVLDPDRQRDRNPQHQPEGSQQQESRGGDREVEGPLKAVVHREALAGTPAGGAPADHADRPLASAGVFPFAPGGPAPARCRYSQRAILTPPSTIRSALLQLNRVVPHRAAQVGVRQRLRP